MGGSSRSSQTRADRNAAECRSPKKGGWVNMSVQRFRNASEPAFLGRLLLAYPLAPEWLCGRSNA